MRGKSGGGKVRKTRARIPKGRGKDRRDFYLSLLAFFGERYCDGSYVVRKYGELYLGSKPFATISATSSSNSLFVNSKMFLKETYQVILSIIVKSLCNEYVRIPMRPCMLTPSRMCWQAWQPGFKNEAAAAGGGGRKRLRPDKRCLPIPRRRSRGNKNRLGSTTYGEEFQKIGKDWQRFLKKHQRYSSIMSDLRFWPLNDHKTQVWPDPPNVILGCPRFSIFIYLSEHSLDLKFQI